MAVNEIDAVLPILQTYLKPRRTRFATKNKVNPGSIDVVNEPPISELFKTWKRENQIRTRIYKNLTLEQQQAWVAYFDEHKSLTLHVHAEDEPTEQLGKVNEVKPPKLRKHDEPQQQMNEVKSPKPRAHKPTEHNDAPPAVEHHKKKHHPH